MVTIKQALTNTHGASINRTLKDIKVGEAFKWVLGAFTSPRNPQGWCVRLEKPTYCKVVSLALTASEIEVSYLWTPLEGEYVGHIFTDSGNAEVHQP